MQNRNRQSFIHGAIILTVATMLVKVIGMLYKIPLGNILGAGGMSYFMSAYSIFNPIYALSVAGFPVAVSKLVSEYSAKQRWRDVRRIRRVSLVMFLCTGTVGMLAMLLGAGFFARMIGNPQAALSIAAIAPAIFFCCIVSSFRGYYQGLHNMVPTAVSQVVESVAKLACGILLAYWAIDRGLSQYAADGTVFGAPAASWGQAQLLVLPYGAAGAVLGVTASTAVGALYLFCLYLFRGGDRIDRAELLASPPPRGAGKIAGNLAAIALPVCLSAAVAHISNLIDVATIMNRVAVAMERGGDVVMAQYGAYLPAGLAAGDIPSYLYGAFGYTNSLFNLVPSISVALGISALPELSSAWALGRKQEVAERVQSVLKLSALMAIPAGLGLAALAEPILALLYPARLAEVAIAAPLLRRMGYASVFVGITTPMMSLFQAVGKTTLPVKLMLGGALLKAVSNYILLAVPSINIGAAPIGTIVCYLFILLAGLWSLRSCLQVRLDASKTLLKPLFCGMMCAITANTCYGLLGRVWDSSLTVLVAMGAGGLIYLIFILFLRIITKKEAFLLPNGKKIVKILEKLRLLG